MVACASKFLISPCKILMFYLLFDSIKTCMYIIIIVSFLITHFPSFTRLIMGVGGDDFTPGSYVNLEYHNLYIFG